MPLALSAAEIPWRAIIKFSLPNRFRLLAPSIVLAFLLSFESITARKAVPPKLTRLFLTIVWSPMAKAGVMAGESRRGRDEGVVEVSGFVDDERFAADNGRGMRRIIE